jgi:hypothetical protein
MEKVHSVEPRQYPTSFGEGRLEKGYRTIVPRQSPTQLRTSVLAFDVLRLIERAFLPKPTTRAYNHYGSECIDFLLFCFC